MIVLYLVVLGLILGSFVNALVWRVHEQEKPGKKTKAQKELSITHGRSMCPHCRHELAAKDLVPLFSWLLLRGKCRYCHKSIGWQYPVVEVSTALLFVGSYIWWPYDWNTVGIVNFAVWLIVLTGFVALTVYDLRWMILPNRIVYPLIGLVACLAAYNLAVSSIGLSDLVFSVAIAGGLFYGLFVLSKGRWIGGGDVKLGFLLGLLLADPLKAFMVLLVASLLGTLVVLPGLASKRLTSSSRIPFGPFLIAAGILVFMFGAPVADWYQNLLLLES